MSTGNSYSEALAREQEKALRTNKALISMCFMWRDERGL